MKAKLLLLIAAGLFFATVSNAQYGGAYVNAQVVIPGGAIVAYSNNYVDYGYNYSHDRYEDRQDRRENEYEGHGHRDWREGEYEGHGRGHREWKEDAYENYCREHREYRGCRNDFYRDYYGYRTAPYCAPRRVVVYGY
jgi:hypothetical protein